VGLPGIDYESGGAPRPRKVRQVSIKPVLERAREKRYPDAVLLDIADMPQPAADAVVAGLVELETGALTPQAVELMAAKWQAALQLPAPTNADTRETQYLQAVFALQRQREEAQRQLQEKRAKDDDQALSALLLAQ
jgi:hypothetical protein